MVWTPGGRPTGSSSGGRVIEPVVPPTVISDTGTYTDVSGKPISREEAIRTGRVSGPGATGEALKKIGVTSGATGAIPAGTLEGAKKAEMPSERTFFLGTAQARFRERPQELTQASRAAVVQSFFPQPPSMPAQTQEQPYVSPFHPTIPSLYGREIPERTTQIGFYPAQPGSIAEAYAFEQKRREFITYKPTMRLISISERLQTGLESRIGYGPKASLPVKAISGFGSVFTGLPTFAGQTAFVGEAFIRKPIETITKALPRGFGIFSQQMYEQATTKPVEFTGSLAGMTVLSVGLPKIGSIFKEPMRGGLLERAQFVKNIRAYNVMAAERGSAWIQAPKTAEQYNLMVGERLLGSRKVSATEFIRTALKREPIQTGISIKPLTAEAYTKLYGEREPTLRVRGPRGFIETAGKRIVSPISTEGRTIAEYNKLVAERLKPGDIRSTRYVNVMEYLMVGGPKMITPSVRYAPRVKASTTGLRLTALRGIREGKTPFIIVPFMGLVPREKQITYRGGIVEQAHRDILASRREIKTRDTFGFKTIEQQGTAAIQSMGQLYTPITAQMQEQTQFQTQVQTLRNRYASGVREIQKFRIREPEKIKFPSTADILPFGKKRRKVKRKVRVFGEVSPIASIGEMFRKRGRK